MVHHFPMREFDHSLAIAAPADRVLNAFFDSTDLAAWWHVSRSLCHARPLGNYAIEWDATDMSSFEARAADDVVVVKYVGCDLKILDGCSADESVRGSSGAYKAPEWTAGSLEKIDIGSEGELYAKLPLGAATLGGRVSGGEKFHMEYYVSGTRTSTRPAVYKADLAKNPSCKGATHFVYAYNLGAFSASAGTFSVFLMESSPSVQVLNTNGNSNTPGSCDSIFFRTSSVKPFALSEAWLMCGQPWSVAAPRLCRTMSSTCHGA